MFVSILLQQIKYSYRYLGAEAHTINYNQEFFYSDLTFTLFLSYRRWNEEDSKG